MPVSARGARRSTPLYRDVVLSWLIAGASFDVATVNAALLPWQELCHGDSALSPYGDEHCDAHLRACHGKLNGAKSAGVTRRRKAASVPRASSRAPRAIAS